MRPVVFSVCSFVLIITSITSLLTVLSDAQATGNVTQRASDCAGYKLPQVYEQYTDTAFLGDRKYVEAGPVNYTYYSFGPLDTPTSETPLLMIPGHDQTLSIWTPDLLKTLASGREVIIFDYANFGLSTGVGTAAAASLQGIADSVLLLMDVLHAERPVDLLGWSQGGHLALMIVTQAPDAVRKVVVTDTHAGSSTGASVVSPPDVAAALAQDRASGTLYQFGLFFPDTAAGNDGLCRLLAFQKFMPNDEPTKEQILTAPTAATGVAADGDLYSLLKNTTNPVLIIAGSLDTVDPFPNDLAMLNDIPDASLVRFADAGHASMLQHSLTSAAIISAFLDDAYDSSAQDPAVHVPETAGR